MLEVLFILMVAACGYGAYRAFRGGFETPQSNRLNAYGIIGIGIIVILLVSLIDRLFF
jgi:hypothetical protein